ncbi:hypothetical protein [Radiobacillus sp. PE A8.2]
MTRLFPYDIVERLWWDNPFLNGPDKIHQRRYKKEEFELQLLKEQTVY